MLGEISMTQKDKHFMVPLIGNIQNSKKVYWWLLEAGGEREVSIYWAEFQFGKMKTFWRWTVVMIIQQCKCI